MKYYKAIFELPDDIIPPPIVGFQLTTAIQMEQGVQFQPQFYKAALMLFNSKVEECDNYREVKDD